MDKQMVQQTINNLLGTLQKEQQTYTESLTKDEILEIRKKIRVRIKELNQRLSDLYKTLEDLEQEQC